MEPAVQIAGLAAAVLSVITFIPQAIKVWTMRHDALALEGISRVTLWFLFFTQLCWIFYGLGVNAVWTAIPGFIVAPLVLFMLYWLHRANSRK